MKSAERKEALRLIDGAWRALDALNDIGIRHYRDECCRLALAEEARHRRMFESASWGITRVAAARMLVVTRIARALAFPDRLKIRDVISTQESAIFAASLAAAYPKQCAKALAPFDREEILALDYAALVSANSAADVPEQRAV